jgi:hypothetical protein
MVRLLILLLISQQLLTIHPGIYECLVNGDYYKLELNEDSTYQYLRQGPSFISQITISGGKNKDSGNDNQITQFGIWKYKNDTLILFDSINQVYDKSGVVGVYIDGQNFVSVTVIDEKNNPYSDILVSLNFSKHWEKTDSSGVGKFEYKKIRKIYSDWGDTISDCKVDTIAILSIEPDEKTGLPNFEFHNLQKKKSYEDIPIVKIQIKNGEKSAIGKWLDTFDNNNTHANHFTITQDFNPIVKKEIRIRKLPVMNDVIFFTNPSYKHDGHIIKLENKK